MLLPHGDTCAHWTQAHEDSASCPNLPLDIRDGSAVTPEEIWRAVPGYVGWVDVSTLGRVRRWYRHEAGGRVLVMLDEPALVTPGGCDGYLRILLQRGRGPLCNMPVHRAVLLAHVGPCPVGFEACHFPVVDRSCCELSTLRWDSRRENLRDAVAHQTRKLPVIQARLDMLRAAHPHLRESAAGIDFRPRRRAIRLRSMGAA